jgi:hypothetical protein
MTEDTKHTGYVYCMSNPSMPGILKVGMTTRTPEDRAKELFKTGLPTPFKVEFAKLVSEPKKKETTLHLLLEQYTERVNHKREFFRVSPEIVNTFFDLMDGEMWVDTRKVEEVEEEEGEEEEEEEEEEGEEKCRRQYVSKDIFQDQAMLRQFLRGTEFRGQYDATTDNFITDKGVSYPSLRKWSIANSNVVELKSYPDCWKSFKVYDGEKYVNIGRDMTTHFINGQQIRHTIGINKTWIGTYDSSRNGIVHNEIFYKSMSGFVNNHHHENCSYKHNGVNGWLVCEYEANGVWISTKTLKI